MSQKLVDLTWNDPNTALNVRFGEVWCGTVITTPTPTISVQNM